MIILEWLEWILFIVLAAKVVYLLVFSIASRRKRIDPCVVCAPQRIAILVPAYNEDGVIAECVRSCLNQIYPKTHYDVVVISDHMREDTNQLLLTLGARVIVAHFENSTKAKALNLAMSQIGSYDIALILDADNTIEPDFLQKINHAPLTGTTVAYQAHRTAKNKNTHIAYLDAISEEINNTIFRKGHVRLGLSSALIGSGMAFRYPFFKKELAQIDAVGGFDRALELTLFKAGNRIGYLENAYVWDEKIQNANDFARQRRRWLSAQHHYLMRFLGDLPAAIRQRNWDFCDKLIQQMSLPRIILLGVVAIATLLLSVIHWPLAMKWWGLLLVLIATLALAIPKELYTRQMFRAATALPVTFLGMFLNLFRLKGANKKFIHTRHGVK